MVRRAPVVDVVVGPQSYHRLGELIARTKAEAPAASSRPAFPEDKFARLPAARERRRTASAFLPCRRAATSSAPSASCPIRAAPSSRARSSNRGRGAPACRQACARSRCSARTSMPITARARMVGPWRSRNSSPAWPTSTASSASATRPPSADMTHDLIAAHRDEPKLMPYLHLPFQAGSDRILATMNRKHTAADYLGLAARIRTARPDLALSTDIIVGFPGETEGTSRPRWTSVDAG